MHIKAEANTLTTNTGINTLCAIGKGGLCSPQQKHEGDSKTPYGTWPIRQIFYRADRLTLPTNMQMQATEIRPGYGWNDDANSPQYNQFATGLAADHPESFTREDELYDVIVVLGYNDSPAIPNKGSAIFLHIAKNLEDGSLKPTAGCVAIPKDVMLKILPDLTETSTVEISE